MRSGQVLYKNELAGMLSQLDNGSFNFSYNEQWIKLLGMSTDIERFIREHDHELKTKE